ncbi:MAG: biotin/lipoyl-containing protein [Terriglobia bacterium]
MNAVLTVGYWLLFMKFEVEIEAGKNRAEHWVEANVQPASSAAARAGKLDFALDGERHSADWSEVSTGVYSILLNGKSYEVRIFRDDPDLRGENGHFAVSSSGVEFGVRIRDRRARPQKSTAATGNGPLEIRAPMPGRIVKVLASEGIDVECGDGLMVIEAMKMQNEIRAPRPGRVEKILVKEGTGVETGARLLLLV